MFLNAVFSVWQVQVFALLPCVCNYFAGYLLTHHIPPATVRLQILAGYLLTHHIPPATVRLQLCVHNYFRICYDASVMLLTYHKHIRGI